MWFTCRCFDRWHRCCTHPLCHSSLGGKHTFKQTKKGRLLYVNRHNSVNSMGICGRAVSFLPQIPSLIREDGMKAGRKPALVQWKLPLGQAAVPETTKSRLSLQTTNCINWYRNCCSRAIHTRFIRAILAVTVIIIDSIKRYGPRAVQTREWSILFIELSLCGSAKRQDVKHGQLNAD